jgi:putative tricarboxylic transport membrane protein
MIRVHNIRSVSILALLILLLSACGLDGGSSDSDSEGGGGGDFQPSRPEFLVHTGPGGGSDIFVRDIIEIMRDEGIISGN